MNTISWIPWYFTLSRLLLIRSRGGRVKEEGSKDGNLLGGYDNTGALITEHVYLNDTPIIIFP